MPNAKALPARLSVPRSRSIRLWSGLVLGLYLVFHFVNIALGLVSVGAMEAAAPFLMGPWHNLVGTAQLGSALLAHFALSLRGLYRRRTLRMSVREGAQLALGLLLPFLLVSHVVSTRIEPFMTGTMATYGEEVRALWVTSPFNGGRQVLALLVGWAHGCFGLWFWLRTKPWLPAWTWLLYALALLIPILALLGFAEAGREIVAFADVAAPVVPKARGAVGPDAIRYALYAAFAAGIGGVLAARGLRWWQGRHRRIRVGYPDGRSVSVPRGFSVLEASRVAKIPHVSLCGGSGRCSTCRVRVIAGLDHLPPAHAQERATLARSHAAPDTRLACQLRPVRDVVVMPVFAAPRPAAIGAATQPTSSASHERELAVLFCDLRGFTRRAEQWLPFDTVFLLNRYFEIVGEAVADAGGYLDKFIGDGALALFGLATSPEAACRQALVAAASIARGLDGMNAQFAAELSEPLRIAMGLNTGAAIVGSMGYGSALGLTAVGDGINVASRLEGEAKDRDVMAVVATAVMRRAGLDPRGFDSHSIAIRGRTAPVDAVLVPDVARLMDGRPVDAAQERA